MEIITLIITKFQMWIQIQIQVTYRLIIKKLIIHSDKMIIVIRQRVSILKSSMIEM